MIGATREEVSVAAVPERFDTAYIYAISLVAALGGLLFGYDWVVIGGAKPFYEKFFRLTDPSQQGWAMSCALVGCLIGALVSGGLSDRFGHLGVHQRADLAPVFDRGDELFEFRKLCSRHLASDELLALLDGLLERRRGETRRATAVSRV